MSNFDPPTRGGRPPAVYNFARRIAQITASPMLFYTNSTEGRQRVKLAACNTGVVDTAVSAYLVVEGDTADATNAFWWGVPLQVNETITFPFEIVLEGGDEIWMGADDLNQVNFLGSIIVEL